MQRIGGLRRKTRHLLTKPLRQKGKINITRYLQDFEAGDKVKLLYDSSVSKSFYKMRYFGKIGIIGKKRGECYEIAVKSQHNKDKTLIVHPVHLMRL